MSRRLRVHHLITKLELGGAQQNTLYCAAHHDRARYEVSLGAGPGGFLDGEARRLRGCRVHWFPGLRREIRPAADAAFVLRYAGFLRRAHIEILHTHSSKAGMLGRAAAALARTPVVIHTVHGWGFHDFQSWPVRRLYVGLERLAAPLTDLLFSVSAEDVRRGLAAGIGHAGQYRVVRSGIDVAAFARAGRPRAAVRRALGIPAAAPLVLTVGNFKAQKAPLDFVRAAAQVRRRVPAAWFLMAGDGEQKAEARRLGDALGLKSRLVLPGWRRDIADLLHAADVFALASLHEGLPRSVLQAAAAGLPVVATAVNGTPEAVRDGRTGYLVPPRAPQALGARIADLAGHRARARAMGRAGRALIGEEFEIRAMLRRIETLYEEQAALKGLR